MDAIHLNDLAGYEEEKVTLPKFQRPYRALCLAGVLAALGGFLLLIAQIDAHNHPDPTVSTTSLSTFWRNFDHALHAHGLPHEILYAFPNALLAVGLVITAITMIALARATPISQVSGQRMEKFWNAEADPGNKEIFYVDEASSTYFRRPYAMFSVPR